MKQGAMDMTYEVLVTKDYKDSVERYVFRGDSAQDNAFTYAATVQEMADWAGYAVTVEVKEMVDTIS